MSNKEVYLVIDEWVVGGDESCDEVITVYNSYTDAKKDYEERCLTARADGEQWNCDKIDEGKYEDCEYFYTYRDGYYGEYHISIKLIKKEVK